MFDKRNKNGLTLIETLIATAILGSAAVAGIKIAAGEQRKERSIRFAEETKSIVKAVDKRFFIDGYDSGKWNDNNWTNTDQVINKLLREELVGTGSNCKTAKWTPMNIDDVAIQPIACDLFNVIPYELKLSAKNRVDGSGFVDRFDLKFEFKNKEAFKDSFQDLSLALVKLKSSSEGLSGTHLYSFTNRTTNDEITKVECVNLEENCALTVSLVRDGGSEYLRTDGLNSLINTHLTFIETRGQSPLKCVRWYQDTSNTWQMKADEECGIGIYNGSPLMTEVVADTGTFESVMLDKRCDVLSYNASLKEVVKTGATQPCGLFNNGTEAIQVLDSAFAMNGYYQFLFANEAQIKQLKSEAVETTTLSAKDITASNKITADILNGRVLNIDDIIAKDIVSRTVTTDQLKVAILAEINNLKVTGASVFNGTSTFNNKMVVNADLDVNQKLKVQGESTFNGESSFNKKVTFKEDVEMKKDLQVDGHTALNTVSANKLNLIDLHVSNTTTTKNLNVTNNASINGDLTVGGKVTAEQLYASGMDVRSEIIKLKNDMNGLNNDVNDLNNDLNTLQDQTATPVASVWTLVGYDCEWNSGDVSGSFSMKLVNGSKVIGSTCAKGQKGWFYGGRKACHKDYDTITYVECK